VYGGGELAVLDGEVYESRVALGRRIKMLIGGCQSDIRVGRAREEVATW
jgi:hypothetical protein